MGGSSLLDEIADERPEPQPETETPVLAVELDSETFAILERIAVATEKQVEISSKLLEVISKLA